MTEIFKTLSEENRLRILSLLLEGEMCVCEIEACLYLTQSNASRHLAALKRAGIVESHKKALWTYFCINDDFIRENAELWNYLKLKLKEIETYTTDYEQYHKCKSEGLCGINKKPH